jgi:hypothetical protein
MQEFSMERGNWQGKKAVAAIFRPVSRQDRNF